MAQLYIKLDVNSLTNSKLLTVGLDGYALYVRGLTYARLHLTDGFVPKQALPLLAMGHRRPHGLAQTLCDAGLWEPVAGGWTVGEKRWSEHQNTREQVAEMRASALERQRRHRSKTKAPVQNGVGETMPDVYELESGDAKCQPVVTPVSRVTETLALVAVTPVSHKEEEEEEEEEEEKEEVREERGSPYPRTGDGFRVSEHTDKAIKARLDKAMKERFGEGWFERLDDPEVLAAVAEVYRERASKSNTVTIVGQVQPEEWGR